MLLKGPIGKRSHRGESVPRVIGARKKRPRIGGQACSRIKWTSRGFSAAYTKVKFLLLNIIGMYKYINDFEIIKIKY